ncbi:MAG: RDD family protein [Alphaproteobacteria bacterium]|nr:RDD family protein [Alphaproteobacteria bacterium]
MSAAPIDTLRTVHTPEGVALTLRVAGPIPRSLAWTVDVILRSMMYSAVAMPLGFLGEAGQGLFMVIVFVGEWFYPVLFEALWNGQTPGKRVMGLAVVHDNGTPVGWSASILRNLLRAADFLPFFYLSGVLSMIAHPSFKRLGDMAAGTLVVHRAAPRLRRTPEQVEPLPPSVPLRLTEQRAIMDFADRVAEWSPERRRELAELLEPLIAARGDEAVRRLLGIAAWLEGRR